MPLSALVAIVALLIAPSKPSDAAQCTWQVFEPPNPGTYDLLSAATVIAANDVWAAGYYTTSSGEEQIQFQHFDGTAWSFVAAPNLPSAIIFGISALAPNDIWAVGEQAPTGGTMPLVLHWNGLKWSVFPNPAQSFYGLLSSSVAISDRYVWAAGFIVTSGNYRPLIEHFDGRRWVIDNSYNPPNQSILQAITGTSLDNLWAGGYYNGGANALIEDRVRSRRSWVQSQTNIGNYIDAMSARSKTDVWAVGPPSFGIFVEQWNGVSWNKVQYPRGSDAVLTSVDATSQTGYTWFAGFIDNSGQYTAFVDRYHRGRWQDTGVTQVGTYQTAADVLGAVPGTNDVWAVGYYGDTASTSNNLAERWTCPSGAI